MDEGKCSSCRAPVLWVVTKAGKRMPLDPEPDAEAGNVLVCNGVDAELYDTIRGRAVVLRDAAAIAERGVGTPLYVSHFATCPNARQHRHRG